MPLSPKITPARFACLCFFLKESIKDMIWTLGFRCVWALVLITEFHSWIARAVLHDLLPVVVVMAYCKILTIKTKPKKISIDGLSELSVFFEIEKIIIYFNFWMWWTLLKKLYSELFSHRTALNSPTWRYFTCCYISPQSTCYSQRP